MTIDIKSLGEAAAQTLSSKVAEKTLPQTYARQYIDIVAKAQPGVKLPAIMSLEQTEILMEAAAVTRSHLREALAAARKDIKRAEDGDLKPKRRPRQIKTDSSLGGSKKQANSDPAKTSSLSDLFDDPLVPN